MNTYLSLLAFNFVILATALLATATGYRLLTAALGKSSQAFSFDLGGGFFLGTAAFLALWRCTAIVLNRADLPLYFTVATFVGAGGWVIFKSDLLSRTAKAIRGHLGLVVTLSLLLPVAVLIYWSEPSLGQYRNWNHFGSCHALRYANIALQVFRENRIPIYGQDYEQSLLATIPSFFGWVHPVWGLYQWLCLSILAMIALTYGIFRQWGFDHRGSLGASFLTMAGSTALSFIYMQTVDNGFPLLLTGKVDLARSAGSFLIFLAWLRAQYTQKTSSRGWSILLVIVLALSWSLSAMQDLFLAFVLIAALLWTQRKKGKLLGEPAIAMLAMLVATGAVSQHGGMLTKVANRDTKEVPGVINFVKFPARRELLMNPTVPFTALGAFQSDYLPRAIPFTFSQLVARKSVEDFEQIVFAIEWNLWCGIKTMFFPLLGIVLMALQIFGGGRNAKVPPFFKPLWFSTVLVFLAGLPINTLFDIGWYRWGLTRFMLPGYLLGGICLILAFREFVSRRVAQHRVFAWAVLAFFLLVGPLSGFTVTAFRNVCHFADFSHRVAFLAINREYVP